VAVHWSTPPRLGLGSRNLGQAEGWMVDALRAVTVMNTGMLGPGIRAFVHNIDGWL
jgi:hypothetical protein